MGKLLAKLLVTALTLVAISYLVPGISVGSFSIALLAALVFGLLNVIVRPLLIILTLPVNIVTLGLFTLVINAFMFWFSARFVPGFEVAGALAAFTGALVLSAINYLTERLLD